MSGFPILGRTIAGAELVVDVERLVATRALLTANSGAGKSWALRRLLEQTHGRIQQLVIDPEGEFYTLREKHDYVLAGRGGDCPAEPRSAALLARRLLELGTSAVLDLYELAPRERVRFVKLFLEALVDAPRELWHPCLVVIDEAHAYAPEKGHGEAESVEAVSRLMAQGRKRGFAGVLATQRLSKLAKDVAAEANNVLIGRAALDVDIRRAGEALGLSVRDAAAQLRALAPGHFFAFGPAFSDQVVEIVVGPVATSHPRAGQRSAPPPPPREKVRSILGQLADLPKEAEAEAATIAEARKRVRDLERELAAAKKAQPTQPAPKIERVEVPVVLVNEMLQIEEMLEEHARFEARLAELFEEARTGNLEALKRYQEATAAVQAKIAQARRQGEPVTTAPIRRALEAAAATPAARRAIAAPARAPAPRRLEAAAVGDSAAISGVGQRILDALAELELLGAESPERTLAAFLAGYSNTKSTGFVKALGLLSTAMLVDYPTAGTVALTESGRTAARFPARPRSAAEVQARVVTLLGGVTARILEPLIAAYPEPMTRGDAASAAGYSNVKSTGFVKALGKLSSLGFVDYPSTGTVVASPILFLEGR